MYLENCVYTIKHSEDIEEVLATTGQATFREYRNWSGAKKLLETAKAENKKFIILFSPVEEIWFLHSWGVITDIKISDDKSYTDYSFVNLEKFKTEIEKTELILSSSNKNMDQNFIRPYALCKTPTDVIYNEFKNDNSLDALIENTNVTNIEEIFFHINEKMKKFKPEKVETLIQKSIRKDSKIVQLLKQHHNYECQFPDCKAKIKMKNGKNYVEVAHIRPVSKGGKSIIGNLLVLCPNHHKEFDFGDLHIITQDELYLEGKLNGKHFKIKV